MGDDMISFMKRNKIFTILILFTILSFILGSFFYANLDPTNREVVSDNIHNLLNNHKPSFFSFFINHFFTNTFIWILGVSLIGILIIFLLYCFKVFIFSFELSSFLSVLGIKDLFKIILYFIPDCVFLISTFILCFYSIQFSIYLFQFLFFHKNYSFHSIMNRYICIYGISFIGLIISSILEYFIL